MVAMVKNQQLKEPDWSFGCTSVKRIQLTELVHQSPTVFTSQNCKETLAIVYAYPESECIVVSNHNNMPLGLIHCDKFFLKLTGRFGMDMFYRESVTKLMNRNPLIIDIQCTIETLLDLLALRPYYARNDSIIVTKQGKIAGTVHPSDWIHTN
ncbi:hypothetical protein J2T13_002027 [Paenibacillus sp. DS2015]|uniref:hypothetical protein n=1 Tax=Paenibacillus sp. DS2015 TaxID=3373917 RepID=UPI003D1A7FD0